MARKKKTAVKNIGIAAEAPKEACGSEKCPWHGHLKVRGRVFSGKVVSSKALNTAIVEWNYYTYVPKYERYQRKNTRIAAHNPQCIAAKEGDTVTIAECRPLSKAKRFVVVEKVTA
ncbi:MAG: 30S ribosomal protein S17 [Candidatus Aenigmarchaeota archaeon]|nr:30S ribosomal protein S17 [Candidatus Aenigmarchaeota archaeon]